MNTDQSILDFSDPATKRLFIEHVKSLKGKYWYELRRCRNQRTQDQNCFFHGVWLPRIASAMSELAGETVDVGQAKSFLKDRFLRTPIPNKETGEVIGYYTRGTSDLDVAECCVFLESVQQFAQEFLNITLPEADPAKKTR